MAAAWNTILHGDCIAGMNSLPAGSVDLAFADPPFNIGYDYDVYEDSLQADHYLDWSREWMTAVHRALADNGTFWLAIGDEYAAELKVEAQKIGFHCRSWVIWYYTFGVNCAAKFTRSHAHLFYFVKNRKEFVFRADELENRIPSARQLVYNDRRANPKGRLPDDTWIIPPTNARAQLTADEEDYFLGEENDRTWTLRPQDLQSRFRPGEDTWYFPRVAGTFKERAGFHGCQMPEQLLGRIIRVCSEPGAVVMDPFSGSGTTVAVAKKLGRQYMGFDLSPQYVELGLKRLDGIRDGDALDGSAEPLMSAPRTDEDRNAKRRLKPRVPKMASHFRESRVSDETATQREFIEADEAPLAPELIHEAFRQTHQGFSADRLVVDPEMNLQFAEACRQAGGSGSRKTWNGILFRLRKAGKLADIPTTRRTAISWEDCDQFLYASEIAWRMMIDSGRGRSLDEILCDPDLAKEFDTIAHRFAPGFEPLMYRWGALKLRKQANLACMRSDRILKEPAFEKETSLESFDADAIPESPGVYIVGIRRSETLYAGETLNLRGRLERQFTNGTGEQWIREAGQRGPGSALTLRLALSVPADGMLAVQSSLVTRYEPLWNIRELHRNPR